MLNRLKFSSLYGDVDGPVIKNGVPLQGITKKIYKLYGGGHRLKKNGRSNKQLGTRVHNELYNIIEKTNKNTSIIHPWTKQILNLLNNHGLIPLAAEVPIAYNNIGTRVDMIARKLITSENVLISIKTGTRRDASVYIKHPHILPPPFSEFKRCNRILDDIQITAEKAIANKGHDIIFDDAVVIEVPNGIVRQVPSWTSDPSIQEKLLLSIM